MFWEDEVAEQEFYRRILESQPFNLLLNNYFDSNLKERHAKSITLGAVKGIVHLYLDDQLRDACLQEIGKTCCHMFLEYRNINTDTDLDTFLDDSQVAFQGCRRYERKDNLIYDEAVVNGQCWCPILSNIDLGQSCSDLCQCGKSARETYFRILFGHDVNAELLDTVLCTGSDACKWLIHLEPQKTAQPK